MWRQCGKKQRKKGTFRLQRMPMMEKSAESQPEAKKDEKVPGGKQEFRQKRRKNKGCNFGSEDICAFEQSESERVMQA